MSAEGKAFVADERFRQIFEATPDSIIVVDAAGLIQFANARTETLFGYARSEIANQPIEMLIPARFHARHSGLRDGYSSKPTVRPMGASVELFACRKDGTEFSVEISLSPVHVEGGTLIAAAIRDVSERKALEATTRVLTERLINAVESVSDAFALFDGDDRLVLCNSAYRVIFCEPISGPVEGLVFEQILDANLAHGAFSLGAEPAESFKARRMAYRSNPVGSFDVRAANDRSWRFTDRHTSEGGIVSTIWDLSAEVRRIDELREARVAADSANAAKSEFLSSMSHELRTPLNAILGFTQLLQKDKKNPLTDRQQAWAQHVVRGGEHLLRLIDDILDLSRIEAGSVLLSPEAVGVEQVMRETVATLVPMAERTGVQLILDNFPADLPMVFGDRTRISQMLLNYGSNAIKYGRSGGRAVFSATLHTFEHGQRVRLAVRDDGMGIPIDMQGKLFQPFHRAGQETGSIEGTGIGLAITKRLATMMDGAVGFESAPGQGSTFWVDLPATESPARAITAAVEAKLADARFVHAKHTILYVEDNPSNLALMAELIDTLENTVLTSAPNAEIGLELARTQKPSLIILDINLPGMSGYEALRHLREFPETVSTPVVALSALASERDVRRAEQAGFSRYLTKPVRLDELIDVFETFLSPEADSNEGS
jgi:PAS domain S-box-containing protein